MYTKRYKLGAIFDISNQIFLDFNRHTITYEILCYYLDFYLYIIFNKLFVSAFVFTYNIKYRQICKLFGINAFPRVRFGNRGSLGRTCLFSNLIQCQIFTVGNPYLLLFSFIKPFYRLVLSRLTDVDRRSFPPLLIESIQNSIVY